MNTPPKRSLAPILLAAGAIAALSACGANTKAPIQAGLSYPHLYNQQMQTLNIQALIENDSTQLTFTNTTAQSFGPSRVWLNRWFSHEIPGLAVGETIHLKLANFHDEFGKRLRAGGFFATRAPQDIVVAELQTGDTMHRLILVEPRETLL